MRSFESSIHSVRGPDHEQGQKVQVLFEALFSDEAQRPVKYEREKTPEEMRVIEGVIAVTSSFVEEFGAKPITITPNHIHVLDEDRLDAKERAFFEEKFSMAKGFYRTENQDIWIFSSKIKSPLMLAHVLAHEMVHFRSYNSLVLQQDGSMRTHRIGLGVDDLKTDRSKSSGLSYFNELNEAVTEELVKRLYPRFESIPALRQEYQELAQAQVLHESPDLAFLKTTKVIDDAGVPTYEADVEMFSYEGFRNALFDVCSAIQQRHSDEFASSDEVFNLFARAAMTGDVKRIAALVESLGRGRFRSIRELQS